MQNQKLFFVGLALLLACANMPHHETNLPESLEDGLPRDSFVFLLVKETTGTCLMGMCTSKPKTSIFSGSGFVVSNTETGSIIATAAHVCMAESALASMEYSITDIDGKFYEGKLLKTQVEGDICVLYVKNLYKPALKIANRAPRPGDKVYNIAAPLGIFSVQMVPILEGRFNGTDPKGRAVYSLPAAGGSSGSMILNSNFEVVGMLTALHTQFPTITIGPSYDNLKVFLRENINKFSVL